MDKTPYKLELIYNGSCPICSREVSAYARYVNARNLPVAFTDLTSTDLDRYGLSPEDAARRIHVVHNGELVDGLEAFRLLWSEMPRFRWLARITGLPVIRPIAAATYDYILAPLLYGMHRRRQAKADRAATAR